MELTLDQALQKGIEAHKAGQFQEADWYYTAILKANPKHPDANHNMGALAVDVGKVEAALPFFKTAVEANLRVGQYWLSYIAALIKLDRVDDAKKVLEQAKSNGVKGNGFDQIETNLFNSEKCSKVNTAYNNSQEPPEEQIQSLIDLHSKGQYQEVLVQASQLLSQFISSIGLNYIIGTANQNLGDMGKALESYKRVILLRPNYAEAHYNMGLVFKALGQLNETIQAYNKAISNKPDYTQAYNNKGIALQQQGKINQAIETYAKAISIKPDYAEACNNMGTALKDQGKLDQAIEAYNNAISNKPDYAEAHYNKGIALHEQEKLDAAIETYAKAISIKPDYAQAYNNMGIALKDHGKLDQAIEAYTKAISNKPDYAEAHRNLSTIKRYTRDDEQFLQVLDLYQRGDLTDYDRCNLSFALAKMYESVGNFSCAYDHLFEGNALRKKLLGYSIHTDEKLFLNLKKTQPKLFKRRLEKSAAATHASPVFILGMPRSGTTLVEQIVSSHSMVTGAGELRYVKQFGLRLATGSSCINTAAILEFRKNYLLELSKVSNENHFVTDKMPQNFRFIPLICAALPEAKIIHLQRNAAATCWSNFKQYFGAKGLGYCYDLKDVVEYYTLYKDLMKLWQSQYGDRIYNLDYEKLTSDQESETRKLIKYLELDWEEGCLSPQKNKRSVRTASQQQVRQKVYQGSSEAWRSYEPHLNGAFDSLPSS
ncbi:tetratricopeptide repeat protein [Paracoccaceae bacterium]|nr:tetratricopeptide repeat protein [Paracoccaceae bacterium]